jgi:hypothetical protein
MYMLLDLYAMEFVRNKELGGWSGGGGGPTKRNSAN